MSKAKTTAWGLKFGHPTAFRQTVKIGEGDQAERVQLVFEPNQRLDLTVQEVAGIQPFIDTGLIVPWDDDWKGRRGSPAVDAKTAELGNRLAELELDNAALAEQVALLIEQVRELGGEPVVEAADEAPSEPLAEKPKRGRREPQPAAAG